MGMFDYVRCEMPIDGEDVSEIEFQTKDTEAQYLETYIITADGRLVYKEKDREWVDDPDKPVIRGYLRVTAERDIEIPFHGDIYFYASNYCASGPDEFATDDNAPPWRRDYTARFTNGRVEWIRGECEDVPETRKQVPRGEFSRRLLQGEDGAR